MINKVILIGNLGTDPELKKTSTGLNVTNLSLATSESWTDKQTGEKKDNTEWHKVVLYDKLAEIAANYLRKGSKVYLEGRLKTRKWQDQSGADRYTTEVHAQTMKMLDSKSNQDNYSQNNAFMAPSSNLGSPDNMDHFADDIPF